jgi:SNF2 family DNA or RNA helicase
LAIDTALVVAPKRVAETVWRDELANWEHLKGLTISVITGNEKQRKAALAKKADIYTISRDNIRWLCGLYGGSMLPFDMLVIDELSSFKNHDSHRFKALKKVQACFHIVVGLTGTPGDLIDLWAQIYLLDRGKRLGQSITFFRNNFFRRKYSGFGYEIIPGKELEIQALIKDLVISMTSEDYLELPERIDTFIRLDFTSDLKKQYEEFEREKVLEMYSGMDLTEITAVNAGVLCGKLLQFTGGAIYDEEKNVHDIHSLKLDATEEFIEAAQGKPVLIAYAFQHERDRLLQRLKKYRPKLMDGDQDIKDWNAGRINVMLMHPASGGHGLNLQEGYSSALWYGPTYNLELYQQFNKRLHRQGRKYPVNIGHIIISGTEDDRALRRLQDKTDTQDALIESVKAKIKKYLK